MADLERGDHGLGSRLGFGIQYALSLNNETVNLIGVVREIGVPKKSKGSDYCCTLRIVDESSPISGITINFFAKSFEELPCVASAGDIIYVLNATIEHYRFGVNAGINAVFYKGHSSFGLYEGTNSSNFEPYQVSSKRFYAKKQDNSFVEGLRKWAISHPPKTNMAASSDYLSLNEIKEGHGTLICMVLHVCEVNESKCMLFVWDGTDAPSLSVHTKLEEEYENPIHLQLEPSPLSRNVLCEFPTVGTVLRLTSKPEDKLGLHSLKKVDVNKWVHFKNISFEVCGGLWCGILHPTSKLSYLSNEDDLILQRERTYKGRLKGRRKLRMPLLCVPLPSYITDTDHESVPFVTLMDVLCYPKVTSKYKCVVRVVAIMPGHPRDFRDSSGTYGIRLTLEDPTARIHAYLYKEDGVTFFGGHPSIDTMKKMHNMLLGVEETDDEKPRNPPWVQLCLKSYFTDDNDIWASRRYRIFDTRFRDLF